VSNILRWQWGSSRPVPRGVARLRCAEVFPPFAKGRVAITHVIDVQRGALLLAIAMTANDAFALDGSAIGRQEIEARLQVRNRPASSRHHALPRTGRL